jgi:glycosyltransferase involved in cell wall biosynthesis
MISKTAVFTIISLNYGAYARTLMESLQAVHPEWDRHVLLVDRCENPEEVGGELFSTSFIEDLPLPKKNEFLFRYEIMELNTAAKPYMFAQLRRQGYDRVVYIDPDILVIDRLVDVEQLLDEGASAVVTPHLTTPLNDDRHPSELDIMRAGAYNLGFLAIAGLPAADAFIAWWQDKLEYGAISDQNRGLFTDQKWVDLAPGMFGGFAVLRDPGYNVAYWNLTHRPVTRKNGVWMAGESRLRFFHFSGFDPSNPTPFSKHQDRFTLDTIGEARELALLYTSKVFGHDYAKFRARPYAFGVFEDGVTIPSVIRLLYREDSELQLSVGGNPYKCGAFFAQGESGGLPTILRGLWLQYERLQRLFPDPLGYSREHYYRWFIDSGAAEFKIPDAFVLSVSRALNSLPAGPNSVPVMSIAAARMPADATIWAHGLVFLHRRATGGLLSAERIVQYQQVTGPAQFLRLCFKQLRGAHRVPRPALSLPPSGHIPRPALSLPAGGHTPAKPAVTVGAGSHGFPRWRNQRYSGLFPDPGKEAWWVGRQARFTVDRFEGTRLRLRGIHMGGMHQRAHGQHELRIAIEINNALQHMINIAPGPFDVSIDLKELPQTWPTVLYLTPENSFVPSELGLGDDDRRLTVQIASIDIGDINIFDAACLDQHNRERQLVDGEAAALNVPGLNVIGYARSEHGLGQSTRQFVGALDAIGIPSAIIDFNHGNSSRIEDRNLEHRLVSDPVHGMNVFHINADQMPYAEMQLPPHLLSSRYNIGFWHWELPEMLDEHLAGFDRLNEVWAPTAFVQDAVAKKSPVPVVRMPHAIHFTISPDACRAQFGLPEDKFLFLMMYDFSSYQERKNPRASLDAFERAFAQTNANVALVIKTQNAQFHDKDVQALRERIAGRENIIWINETLSRQQVYDLQSVCDALVSLHRSEGFGLGPAEAMFLGKPVIATNWSGNTEFMRSHNSLPVNYRLVTIEKDVGVYRAGQTWAEPDVAHAATLMRQVVDDEVLRANISAEAKRTMQEEFSPKAIGRRIRARLLFIQHNLLAR